MIDGEEFGVYTHFSLTQRVVQRIKHSDEKFEEKAEDFFLTVRASMVAKRKAIFCLGTRPSQTERQNPWSAGRIITLTSLRPAARVAPCLAS